MNQVPTARPHPLWSAAIFTLAALILWALMHPYRGLYLDAQLYALQALAKLHPALAADLYLQNVSQDRYTIFSTIYARLIAVVGLRHAALGLYIVSNLIFYSSAWLLIKKLFNDAAAWLGVGMLVITGGEYGAAHVFHFAEEFLTARSLAEALIVAAIAGHYWGKQRAAVALAAAAFFIHPIMALPGVLLLACLVLPQRLALLGAAVGILVVLGIASSSYVVTVPRSPFSVMDAGWLEVVRERAQFLFLQLWNGKDWELNVRPFVCLIFTFMVVEDPRVKKLSLAALLVGVTGLVIAFVAGSIGPIAILLQGQAWRWVWISSLCSVVLLAPTAIVAWRDEKCGPLCVMLLILAWTFEPVDPLLCSVLPAAFWLIRREISPRMARYLLWTAVVVGVGVVAWAVATTYNSLATPLIEVRSEPALTQRVRHIFQLDVSAVFLFVAFWYWVKAAHSRVAMAGVAAACCFILVSIGPAGLTPVSRVGSAADVTEFSDWISKIPAASTVFVTPAKDAGGFVWFTLSRPNYLSPSQSAGVVFSRETALEVRRRSEVLLPVADPDWKILSRISASPDQRKNAPPPVRQLTALSLSSICRDPALGFVISPQNVGFDPIRHDHAGSYKDWNLYDCRHVRAVNHET